MSKPGQVLVPAFLLRPDWARDGRVAVAVILRVPVPEDPSLPNTLASLIEFGDVADIYAIEPESIARLEGGQQ